MQVIFVTVANLPEGGGRSSRLKRLAATMADLGHQVRILNLHGLEPSTLSAPEHAQGLVQGVPFEYVLGTTRRGYGFRSIPTKLQAVAAARQRIAAWHQSQPVDLLVFNQLAFNDIYPLTRWARRNGVRTIQCYEDERMEIVSRESIGLARRIFGLNSWLADHWCSRMADAIFVISGYLREKYSRLSGAPERVHIIPTIIDCSQWQCAPEADTDQPVLLYSGGFVEHDELERMLDALALLKRRGVAFQMRFVGGSETSPRVARLKKQAAELELAEVVVFRPFQPLKVVREEICASNVLINIRRDSIWSRSGLSTKLSEYLSSGRLVVVSDVGDNRRYLENGRSALIISPSADAAELAAVLEAAIKSPTMRREIGGNGRRAALTYFDVPVAKAELSRILNGLKRTK